MADTPVALVTGASSGIGEAIALRLRDAGFTVYAGARRLDRMAGLASRGVHVEHLDVTDHASATALVQKILRAEGRIDVLVNNAGYGSYGAVEDVPIDEARRQFEVNVFGLARLTQLVVPQLRARRDGYIVNVSSIGGKIYEPLGGWYHATKFAVEGLSDSLRLELAPFGVKVVIVEPGAIATEWPAISADTLEAASAAGAYADQARFLGAVLRSTRLSSEPDAVARAVVRAVHRRRPPTRVAVGGGARLAVTLRRLLPDRLLDVALMRALRSLA